MASAKPFQLAVICGGPSLERGISLNSARSVMDHLNGPELEVIPLYVDHLEQFYRLSQAQLYSNTPADFDFKLSTMADLLEGSSLKDFLNSVDLVFPVIHGKFGEDGQIQSLLESFSIPFVGNSSASSGKMFRKSLAHSILKDNGFSTFPQMVLCEGEDGLNLKIENFFNLHKLKRAIIKPVQGGSSIGVFSVSNPKEALARALEIFKDKIDFEVIIEPFFYGKEFTVVVFQNSKGEPVALMPTEIDLSYANGEIFDFRKKYLPTNHAFYHTPPRFPDEIINTIRSEAEKIFNVFSMRDFVRLDGWVMNNGLVYFTDINPISGLEQNSFLFRQAALVGFSHRDALEHIIKTSCRRYSISFPEKPVKEENLKNPVYVLFGGNNAERQVSLMSGTNIWLKLIQSSAYHPVPFFLDPEGFVWELPYSYMLNHTVEELYSNCLDSLQKENRINERFQTIRSKLEIIKSINQCPVRLDFESFLKRAKVDNAFVFIGMHGGEGEDGRIQTRLEALDIPFNGSNAETSLLCMNKYLTGVVIENLNDPSLITLKKKKYDLLLLKGSKPAVFNEIWNATCTELLTDSLIIKPCSDGCSAGITLLKSAQDLEKYCCFLFEKRPFIPSFSFSEQKHPIEMPTYSIDEFIFEPYIKTDEICVKEGALTFLSKTGWVELTVGVLESQGVYHALNPSVTVSEGSVLSLEEKFQGGTGINFTPPPLEIISVHANHKIKTQVEKAARSLGIQNYARLDIFFNRLTEQVILIEANTLPALTPSTVLYHQGLAEKQPLTPFTLINQIILSKKPI